jgi:hypothetical protein
MIRHDGKRGSRAFRFFGGTPGSGSVIDTRDDGVRPDAFPSPLFSGTRYDIAHVSVNNDVSKRPAVIWNLEVHLRGWGISAPR